MLISASLSNTPSPSLWQTCLDAIEKRVEPSSFDTWFRTIEFVISDNSIPRINVPNQFFADFIEEHFSEIIKEELKKNGIKNTDKLIFTPIEKDWEISEPASDVVIKPIYPQNISKKTKPKFNFYPNYTFDKFVVGDSNRMAHVASMAVAEAPGKTSFNPLTIYGGTGLGKTHLLQAIGHFAQTEGTADKVLYLTSQEFTNQYMDHLKNKGESTNFYKQFIDVDLLLIDDIQFLSGKPGTQKEFYRHFDRLLRSNKQIVLSSDKSPDKIPDMQFNIINRFMGGLMTDIQPPNLETRIEIIQKKADIDGLDLPQEVVQYIAGHITANVRQIEGTLIKLMASCSFTGRPITLELVKEIFGDVISREEQRLSIEHIQSKVADLFKVTHNQLKAHTRKKDIALPRSVAMYLCKKWTKESLRTIGLEFGGRDYSTVIYSCKKIEKDIKTNKELAEKIKYLDNIFETMF